ncbi:uncharacterized protein LOC107266663 isoform X3 [Cephus cinctus]|uniref:Uncharacterized protein LOC107266663 isoform X3 n=1 Tax=Cephus cinctus TaxID=211228 RepID=A0AAJ7BSI5_CEPCN|nr:uncharacterized protein LOC107266663 isoform X3 [Cephus cinctus]
MMDYTGDTGNKGTRWVCPNDRHLALRAKLRTGWSVKTGSLDSRSADYSYSNSYPGSSQSSASSFVLSDEERQTIIEVIRRAEALDLSEQERVGKLVERLENMKRNVTSVTTIRSNGRSCGSRCSGGRCICSCALCGERFAVLGAGPSLCKDCRKYICQKCGIEATPSSAPPFTPTFSTARGNIIPQGIQRTNVQKVFLCRICSETREMWKKSGAWFFKGLPKYVLPEKKVERGRPRAGSRASGWAVAGGIRPLETLEQDSSSDEDATRRLAVTRSLSASAGEAGSNEMATIAQLHEDKYQEHSSISSSRTSPSYHRQSSAPGFEMDYYNSNSGYGESFQSQIPSSASTAGLGFQGSRNVNNFPGQQTSVDDLRKSSVEQLNGSQEGLNGLELSHTGEEFRSRSESVFGLGSGESRRKQRLHEQQYQSLRAVQNGSTQSNQPNGIRTRLRDSGSLTAIRPSGSVPPVQSGTSTRITTYGYSRTCRPILQAEYITHITDHDHQAIAYENSTQDSRPRVQRDPKLLRNHRDRYEERQCPTRPDSSRRSSGTRFLRRSEISSSRTPTLSNEAIQRLPGESLHGGPGGESMGRGYQSTRPNPGILKLQYATSCAPGYDTFCRESITHGQQRVL